MLRRLVLIDPRLCSARSNETPARVSPTRAWALDTRARATHAPMNWLESKTLASIAMYSLSSSSRDRATVACRRSTEMLNRLLSLARLCRPLVWWWCPHTRNS